MTATAVAASRLPEPLEVPDGTDITPHRSFGRALLNLGIFLSYVGIAVLKPELPDNTAIVDVVIGLLCIAGLVSMRRVGSPAVRALARVLPWYWLFLIGSFLGLSHVGVTAWALSSVGRTTVALMAFFAVWHLVEVDDLVGAARKGVYVAAALSTFALLAFDYEYRALGWFPNPNVAGHFGAAIGATIIMMSKRWWVKLLGLANILIAIQVTGSFGAMGMALAMGAVVAVRSMQRNTAVLTVALVSVVIVTGLVLANPESEVPSQQEDRELSSAISERRFEKSQKGRIEIWSAAIAAWQQEPFGIGPNGVRHRAVVVHRGIPIEVHSDPIGVLVDRGPIGLLGFIGIWAAIWSVSKPGGFARILIIGNWVQCLFRETINYRHVWLLLALLMVLDDRRSQAEAAAEAARVHDGKTPDEGAAGPSPAAMGAR